MNYERGTGLLPTPVDERDFPLGGLFGVSAPAGLPRSFVAGEPLIIKDQGNTDMCTAYALTAVGEDNEHLVLDPLYTFARTKQITGKPEEWGADLRSACKSAVSPFGFLPGDESIVSTPSNEMERNEALAKYPRSLDSEAVKHRQKTYCRVDGPYDTFDNIRSGLWQIRDQNRTVFTGMMWSPEWNEYPGGVVNKPGSNTRRFGHALKIFGWEGEYLLAQLSNGTHIGEKGVFKLHRDIVNEYCTFGAFSLVDISREEAEYQLGLIGWFDYWLKVIFS